MTTKKPRRTKAAPADEIRKPPGLSPTQMLFTILEGRALTADELAGCHPKWEDLTPEERWLATVDESELVEPDPPRLEVTWEFGQARNSVPPHKPTRFAHAPDFGWVRMNGYEHSFGGQARRVIAELFKAAHNGDGGVRIKHLGTLVGSQATRFRLEQPFRKKDGSYNPGFASLVEKMAEDRARIRPDVVAIWRAESPNAHQ